LRDFKKELIGAVFFLLLLVASELIFQRLYLNDSRELSQICSTHHSDKVIAVCADIKSSSDAAFSYATGTHILTKAIIFFIFLLLILRLSKTEARLKELEKSADG